MTTDNATPTTESTTPRHTLVLLGPEWQRGGEFVSHVQWVNKAASWLRPFSGNVVCIDALGRYCHLGADFARARDEDAFPVTYYVRTPTGASSKRNPPTKEGATASLPRMVPFALDFVRDLLRHVPGFRVLLQGVLKEPISSTRSPG